ncbi:hypothetical protein ACU18_02635 [Arthrobacter sp. ZBG10]|uniref:DUF4244 domain-containing protein n=1 Tax=unclassified Arthrobacter TaxID=235627 RepID=UPI000680207C|nr:DUF4244 domain-containing protein [Arthrobacter sp. ZBG10]KNH21615.1 hypothetical protein ACU18_02635 [Arthrobacter sp. ZBG10]
MAMNHRHPHSNASDANGGPPPGARERRRGKLFRGSGEEPARADLPENVVELYPGASLTRHTLMSGPRLRTARMRQRCGNAFAQAGMATAEYAIATLAAVGFAGLLVFILRSDEVRGFLLNLIRTALALP